MKFASLNYVATFVMLATLTGGCAVATEPPVTSQTSAPRVTERPGDKFILPQGVGTKDGSSWANAMDFGAGGLQAGWDALQPGQTLWLGSGNYGGARLKISSGGTAGNLKTLAGKDTGGGQPVFTGTFSKDNPIKSGFTFITAADGSDYWGVQDIHIRDYSLGIATKEGGHQGLLIRNFDVTGSREGMSLIGGATPANPELGSHNIDIIDCDFINFTKRGIRMKEGNYDIRVTNCVADAGGKAWATEPFHMGFSIEGDDAARKSKQPGAHDHDITFTNCVALNSYNDAGGGYWNADGFCSERGVTNLNFINCMAFDNTDGGWDCKSENMTLTGCVSIGNKRNYRFWGTTTKMVNCLSAYSVYPGGSGGETGLWTNGVVTVERSTFFNSGISPDDGGKVVLVNSIITRSKEKPGSGELDKRDGLKLVDTVVWDEASGQGENPQFVNPAPNWKGIGDAFNNKKFGRAKGYYDRSVDLIAKTINFERSQPLVQAEPGSTKSDVGTAVNAVAPLPKTPEQLAAEAAMIPVVENADFENGLIGWTTPKGTAYQIKTAGAPQGNQYVTVTAEARVEARGKIGGLVPGETYQLGFQSRASTSKNARVIVRQTTKSKYLGSTPVADTPTWTAKSIKFVAPSNEIVLEISVRSAGTFDLDDFTIKRAK